MSDLLLPEPIGLQRDWLNSPATRKVLRVGRRGSKTRFAFLAAMAGHGPGWEDSAPKLPGVLQGGDVVWISPTYSNLSTVLWREEIVPRMAHLSQIRLDTTKHDVNIPGLGSLMLRSGDREAIDSVRGVGKSLLGVIVDEAAWMDLRGALQDVILPALLDNDGWLIIMSTTNASGDGGYDDAGQPQVPSYFTLLCQEIRAGKRSSEWVEFHGTAFDNPSLSKAGIEELIREYPPDSPKLKQEVYAELLSAGVGLALPRLNADRHLCQRFPIPPGWTMFGAFDWGFNHPWVYCWFAVDPDGNVYLVETLSGRQQVPRDIANTILMSVPATQFITFAGPDIWQQKGRAAGFTGPTIAEQMQQHGMRMVEARDDRVQGLDNLRRYTWYDDAWPMTGENARWPRFRMLATEGNRATLAQLHAMQLDPKHIEDVLKVDADASGRGGDDRYDTVRYGLMSRPLAGQPAQDSRIAGPGRSAGYDYVKQEPRQKLTAEDDMATLLGQVNGDHIGRRYGLPSHRPGR